MACGLLARTRSHTAAPPHRYQSGVDSLDGAPFCLISINCRAASWKFPPSAPAKVKEKERENERGGGGGRMEKVTEKRKVADAEGENGVRVESSGDMSSVTNLMDLTRETCLQWRVFFSLF